MLSRKHRTYPSTQLAAEFRQFVRRNARLFAVLTIGQVLLTVLVSAVLIAFWPHGPVLWYVLGAVHAVMLGMLLAAVAATFVAHNKAAIWYLRGAWGEDNTSELLKTAKRRKIVWGFVQSIATRGGDIDHIVVTRAGGVLAVDSKWRNDVTSEVLDSDAAAAVSAARRAESILRSEHIGTLKRDVRARHRDAGGSFTVTPVVAIWGAVRHEMPEGVHRGGVEFVAGENLLAWLANRSGQPVDQAAATELLAKLAAFRDR